MIRGIEDAGLDVELVEQPVPRRDLDGLAWVSDRVDAADPRRRGGVRRPRPGRGDPPPGRRPGQRQARQVRRAAAPARTLLDLAAEHGMGTLVGSMMESHDRGGRGGEPGRRVRHQRRQRPGRRLVAGRVAGRGGLRYDGATVLLPDAPGLGITASHPSTM